jgi:hypothetical protein
MTIDKGKTPNSIGLIQS